MRDIMRNAFLVTITAAALAAGVVAVSAQGAGDQGRTRHGRSGGAHTQATTPHQGSGGSSGATVHRSAGGSGKQTAAVRERGGSKAVHHGQTGGSKQTVSTRHGKQTASTRHGKQTATSRRGGTHTAKHGGAKGGKKSATTQRRAGKTGTTQRRAGKTVTTQRRAETKNVRQASTSKRVSVSRRKLSSSSRDSDISGPSSSTASL
jgi:hypothetical protein